MSRFIEIYQTLDVAELQIIKSALQHNNIDFTIYDENTLYSSNVYGMGLSGARIMIDKNKHAEAIELLINLIPEKFQHLDLELKDKSSWLDNIEQWKSRIPFLRNWSVAFIVIAFVTILVALISIFLLIN